jgi:nucleoside recognition membrane protein YjiH
MIVSLEKRKPRREIWIVVTSITTVMLFLAMLIGLLVADKISLTVYCIIIVYFIIFSIPRRWEKVLKKLFKV